MKFRETMKMVDAISEYQWDNEGHLVVSVNNYEFDDFMKPFKNHQSLFDDEGILAYLRDHYVVIPYFDDILERIGFKPEDIKEMFEKEACVC